MGGPCYTIGGKIVVGMAAFSEHVALWFHQAAKQEKTKASRVAKILPMIESGVGLNDKYRKC